MNSVLIDKIFYFEHVNKMNSTFKDIHKINNNYGCIRCFRLSPCEYWCNSCSYEISNAKVSLSDRGERSSNKLQRLLHGIYYPYNELNSIKKLKDNKKVILENNLELE